MSRIRKEYAITLPVGASSRHFGRAGAGAPASEDSHAPGQVFAVDSSTPTSEFKFNFMTAIDPRVVRALSAALRQLAR